MTFLSFLLLGVLAQSPQLDAKAIKTAKQTLVSSVDGTLPAISLERWLQEQFGKDVKISWEVNDCGEQSGSPVDQLRDLPLCVAATAQLRDGREVTLEFFAGTEKTGPTKRPGQLYFGDISLRGAGKTIPALRDLPGLLKAQ